MSLHRMSILAPSGAGKTTAIAALLRMGYKVRMFAFEDAEIPVTSFVEQELLENFSYDEFYDDFSIQMKGFGESSSSKMLTITEINPLNGTAFTNFRNVFGNRGSHPIGEGQNVWYVYDSVSSIVASLINWCQMTSGTTRWDASGAASGALELFIQNYFVSRSIRANILLLGHTAEDKSGKHVISGLVGNKMPAVFSRNNNIVLTIDTALSGRRALVTSAGWPLTYLKSPYLGKVPARIPATLVNASGDVYDTRHADMEGPLFAADGLIRYLRAITPKSSLPAEPACLQAPLITNATADEAPPMAPTATPVETKSEGMLSRLLAK